MNRALYIRPLLWTYRLNRARWTSWGLWDEWDDTALQTQDSKFKPWRSEAEKATSWSRRLPIIRSFTSGWGRNMFCFFQTADTGKWTPNSSVKGSSANHYALGLPPYNCIMAVNQYNIGIQMKQKELTFMMILNWKKPFDFLVYTNTFQRCKGYIMLAYLRCLT